MKSHIMDALLAIPAGLSVAVPVLLAQANVNQDILKLAAEGVTIAVLVWYMIFDVRTRTPKMIRAFQDEQEKARETFTQQERENRAAFLQQEKENRDYYREVIGEVRQAFLQEAKETRQAFAAIGERYDRDLELQRQMLYQVLKDVHTGDHSAKGTISQIVGQTTLTTSKEPR